MELKASGISGTTLYNYYRAAKTLEPIEKRPENMEKKDLIGWSADMLDDYAESTANLYRICVKRYFKWLENGSLDGGGYPDCVRWMRPSKNGRNLPKEILSHDEIKRMAQGADSQRNRTMLWAGYESGCRPGELLDVRIGDVEFDEFGAQVMVDGKTGERRVRLVEAVPDLKLWISMHPRGEKREASMWPLPLQKA